MNTLDLSTLLKLVGSLDDSTDPNSASCRFRAYLHDNILTVGDLRAYVDQALSSTGDQYSFALQDLTNHAGSLLGFEVEYGRYRGVRGQIGFDGLWRSPTGPTLVVETKTTDAYTIKTATILGYINNLVSSGRLDSPDDAVGLYAYGRFDADASQLENSIIAEKRQEQLRVISIDALLNLLELKQEYDFEHPTALALILPSPVRVDTMVNLIFDIASQERRVGAGEALVMPEPEIPRTGAQGNYYLLPAADSEDGMLVLENLHHWLDQGLWGLGQRTGYRKSFQPGDKLCFYAVRIGVVVEATVDSLFFELTRQTSPKPHLDVPYGIRLEDVRWFDDAPVPLTLEVRIQLSAFQHRDINKGWAWFVQGTSKLTAQDFQLLTGRA